MFASDTVYKVLGVYLGGGDPCSVLSRIASAHLQARGVSDARELGQLLQSDKCEYSVILLCHKGGDTHTEFEQLLELVSEHKNDFHIPVVAVVCSENDEVRAELRASGIDNILSDLADVKRVQDMLVSEAHNFCLQNRFRTELKTFLGSDGRLTKGEVKFQTRREALQLAKLLAEICPDGELVAVGLCELMINAVEHGCLEIGGEEKWRLIKQGVLQEEIWNRRKLPRYKDRYACIAFDFTDSNANYRITDPGDGFDFQACMIPLSSGIKQENCRGIVMADSCFDAIDYENNGAIVKVSKSII